MRRRTFRKPTLSMSLFPFLAVLVCTMGVLIVLLMSLVQQARVYASHVSDDLPPSEPDPALQDARQQYDEAQWRREILETQRSKLAADLSNQRLQLSHLEEHIRRLERQWQELQQQAATLQTLKAERSADFEQAQEQLQKLRAEIEQARQEYQALQEEVARRPRRFAVIPYDGPHGTQRRPIYIECRENGIVLQPEEIVLTPEDFAGPLGPGNPLDAALRTTREYLARIGQTTVHGEPYPLLLVRPDGAVAYSVARMAMKAWDEEFGYELIEQDILLDFPPPDPLLREEIERAVRDARQRQSALAAAMPNQFLAEGAQGFIATPTRGGFVSGGAPGSATATRGFGGWGGPASGSGNTPPAGQPSSGQRPANNASAGNAAAKAEGDRSSASTPGGEPGGDNSMPAPLAESRGQNWANPKATAAATGIIRPIYITCLPDQLLIMPEKGEYGAPKVIATPAALSGAMDEFVQAVWKHMDQWGLAVANGYWKPVLQVTVGAGAEQRFQELQTVLQGSGLEVKRKER